MLRTIHARGFSAVGPIVSLLLLLAVLVLAVLAGSEAVAQECPPAGTDSFESDMNVEVNISDLGMQNLMLEGPVTVTRSDAHDDAGVDVIKTEIVAMSLTGEFMAMPVTLRINPEESSLGEVRAQDPSSCFLADSYFDVFIEITIGSMDPLVNLEPVRLEAGNLQKLPPLFDTYTHPMPMIDLVAKGTTGPVLATIAGESSHGPVQDPTFSIAAGGTLEPATGWLVPVPNTVGLSRAGLGLVEGDDLNGISFGLDSIDTVPNTTLAFSVDPASEGKDNTGVAQEAVSFEQESAEYVSFAQGTNQLLVEGDRLVPQTGNPGDDVDALVDQPSSRVDTDNDMTPEQPVFMTLAPGSPTLGTESASSADILATVDGVISVFATAADIGLVADDDIDAFCLMKTGLPGSLLRPGSGPPAPPPAGPQLADYMLFSLASGSPTLTAQSLSAADIFVTEFSDNREFISNDLTVYATASDLGLLDSDELNALKCLPPAVMFEISGDGDLDPDNEGSGCEDTEVNGAFVLNTGLANHDGDHLALPAAVIGAFGFYTTWTVQNPAAGDYHGPYGYPGTGAGLFMPTGDPADTNVVNFVGGPSDNCGLAHVHGGNFGIPVWDRFGNHGDPDIAACGHGVFIPSAFPISVLPWRRSDVPVLTEALVDLLNATSLGLFKASWHRYTGPSTLAINECTDPARKRAILILTGLAVTQVNVALLLGPYTGVDLGGEQSGAAAGGLAALRALTENSALLPVRVGPAMRTFPPGLVPEPASPLLAASVLATLGWLSRRRKFSHPQR